MANKKPFRISKKGIPTNIFKKVEDKRNNQMEVKIESNDVNDEQKSMRINLKRGKGSKKKKSQILICKIKSLSNFIKFIMTSN